jgi:hypothetical protein
MVPRPTDSQRFFARFKVKAFHVDSRRKSRSTRRLLASRAQVVSGVHRRTSHDHYFVDRFVDRDGSFAHGSPGAVAEYAERLQAARDGKRPATEVEGAAHPRCSARRPPLPQDLQRQFKRDGQTCSDPRINSRAWWYVEFAARCGIDVCALSILDAQGEAVPTLTDYALGRRCVYPYYDYSAIREAAAAGQLTVLRGLSSWVGAYQAVFRWSDPWPAWGATLEILGRRLTRSAR